MRKASAPSVIVACIIVGLFATAGATPTVFVSPETALVQPGETFAIDVRVDAGTDTVTCFLVEFEFDPAVIELVAAEEGSLFSECGFPTMFNWDVLGPGHHSCNDVTLGPYTYTVAPGELLDLEFIAGEAGSTPVHLIAVDLRDYRRERILPVWTADGTVVIVGNGVDDGGAGADSGDAPGEASGDAAGDEPGGPAIALTAFPNPFKDTVEIRLSPSLNGGEAPDEPERALPRGAPAVSVHGASGRLIATPSPERSRGGWVARWGGRDVRGDRCAAGIYFVEFVVGDVVVRKPVVLVH